MKLNDIKHNHSLTDLLKILIFSILMMIPFIDVGIRCAYVVCNKNAYQSYYGETINEYEDIYISQYSQLNTNTKYYFNTISSVSNVDTNYGGSTIGLIVDNVVIDGVRHEEVKKITFYHDINRQYHSINFRDVNSTALFYYDSNNPIFNTISWNYISLATTENNLPTLNVFLNDLLIHTREYNKYSYLDNVFDYSVNKLTTSELYTWTQQTAIYTGVQTMCTHLGINNSVIPLLLVYWFILTIIYIIIDIVLKLFTMLTHAIGSKTA